LQIKIFQDRHSLSRMAAAHVAKSLRAAIRDQDLARIVAATGTSPIESPEALTTAPNIGWGTVAVKSCLVGEISQLARASILCAHPHATVYLDKDSTRLLSPGIQTAP